MKNIFSNPVVASIAQDFLEVTAFGNPAPVLIPSGVPVAEVQAEIQGERWSGETFLTDTELELWKRLCQSIEHRIGDKIEAQAEKAESSE